MDMTTLKNTSHRKPLSSVQQLVSSDLSELCRFATNSGGHITSPAATLPAWEGTQASVQT